MKKLIILAGLAFAANTAMAQNADSYIVKTKGVTKTGRKRLCQPELPLLQSV